MPACGRNCAAHRSCLPLVVVDSARHHGVHKAGAGAGAKAADDHKHHVHQHAAAVRLYGQHQQQAGCHIIHYINLHLKKDLTLSTLAARFNLSRSYLSDRFHREVHSNLTDYVTRIQFAANLLRYHHYTITQAAQEVGIPDVPYFTRLFKRTMGETPSQYARKKAIEA